MAVCGVCTGTAVIAQQLQYPATRKSAQVDTYHGVKVPDPYRWLEDDHSAETAAWVEAQNKVTFPSRDAGYAVYGMSRSGSDWMEYRVMDLATRMTLDDTLQWVKVSSVAWQKGGFYYSRYPAPGAGDEKASINQHHHVYFHRAGTLASTTPAAAQAPRITRIEFRPAPEEDGGGVIISLLGSGQCAYTIDYGDGKSERRTADLPDEMRHAYEADNEYAIVATPEAPCEGTARARLDIRAIRRGIWKVTVAPGPSTERPEVVATIEGRGDCAVMVDFGDSSRQRLEGTLPLTVNHPYEKEGAYELHAAAEAPCRGDVRLEIDVRR